MFAEELGGNASRKRQEENRARRRKLKQEQLKKKNDEQKNQTQDLTVNSPVSTVTKSVVDVAPATAASTVAANKQPSVVEIATAQRQQRHEVQVQRKACIKIQSFYRTHISNCLLINEQTMLLNKRLQDLSMLTSILKEKSNTDYIPPQQTVTALCQQTIFLTRSIPYQRKTNQHLQMYIRLRDTKRDSKFVQQIFDLVLNPGLTSNEGHINPFAVWIQSHEGKLRIQYMMRLALVVATDPLVDSTVWKSCLNFIRIVTVSKSMSTNNPQSNNDKNNSINNITASIVEFCHPLVFEKTTEQPAASSSLRSIATRSIATMSASLDLISLLRNHLLYTTGGAPNPLTSTKLRESCISSKQREQADILFQTVILVIQSTKKGSNVRNRNNNTIVRRSKQDISKQPVPELEEILMLRFFSVILTIPLLTWKVSDASIKILFSYRQDSFSQQNQLYLLSLIGTFTNVHREIMNNGDVESVLCQDLPLKKAGATPIQCLLANMVQLGSSCVQLNGSKPDKLDFEASATFFRFLATLVDTVPVSTLSSRDSVVEWVSDGGHHSPVILSPIILEHCRMIVADGWVRKLFQCAMDLHRPKIDEVLMKKTDKDLKMEKELSELGSSSVASLAAKEARVDRNRSFWKSSAWARNLTKGVSKILNSSGSNKGEEKKDRIANNVPSTEGGKLINASAVSRKLAMGKQSVKASSLDTVPLSSTTTSDNQRPLSYSPNLLKALCRLYGIVLARWGGSGGEDIVHQKRAVRQGSKKDVASTSPEPCTQSLLGVLCFSTNFIRVSWGMIQSSEGMSPDFGLIPIIQNACIRPVYNAPQKDRHNDCLAIFYLFVESLAYQLILTDDTEIHNMERPIPLHQLRRCIIILKQLLYKACCTDDAGLSNLDSKQEANYFGLALIKASSKTMWDLYDRSSRRLICVPNLWIVEDLMEAELRRCKTEQDYVSLLSANVLRVCPFLVSFKRRLRLFERIVYTNRAQIQGENSTNPFNSNPLKPGIPVRITRGRILEDGLATMNNLGSDMRQRISIQYYNEAGTRESGIDAGGLFKEFWTDLCAIAFDPNYALFCVTEDNCMYPNPSSGAAHGNDHIELFMFLGRVLGKSLYESITVHPQFAHFFLSFLRGDYNYLNMFSDLGTIDKQLHNNLMFLKTYDGDAEDLCLSFTVSVNDFGGTREIPLLPNGANVDVTNSNKHRYIGKC